jgi:hypothetical protein
MVWERTGRGKGTALAVPQHGLELEALASEVDPQRLKPVVMDVVMARLKPCPSRAGMLAYRSTDLLSY